MNKKQIIFIRGGETFESKEDFYKYFTELEIDPYDKRKSWRDWLTEVLNETHEFIVPNMPARENADYNIWKIWFEKYLKFFHNDGLILIGYSLGTTFLLKYLTENSFSKKISQIHLVASCVVNDGITSLERLSTFEFDIEGMNKITNLCDDIHLWHSEDDDCVPYLNSVIIKKNISNSILHSFKDRGHLFMETFPELLEVIKQAK